MPQTEPHSFGANLLKRWPGTWRAALLSSMLAATALPGSASAQMTGPITLESTGSFFVGGQDKQSDGLSPTPGAPSGTWTANQMYVQFQRPYEASHLPIVLIHGCCLTGKTWETTPDGRMGWYRVLSAPGLPDLRCRSSGARPVGIRHDLHQRGRAGQSGRQPTAIDLLRRA